MCVGVGRTERVRTNRGRGEGGSGGGSRRGIRTDTMMAQVVLVGQDVMKKGNDSI
jgi:hypothetical protein